MTDEVPFEILDDFPETGDLSGQTGGDVIDPAQGVRFTIQELTPDIFVKEGVKQTAKLKLRAAVSTLGIDGNGKYANKNLLQDLITWVNTDVLTSDWWKKQARFPYRQFLKALGLDDKNPPKISDEFLQFLKGKEFRADVKKSEIKLKGSDGKYSVPTGDFKNELVNFKAAE